ncbi:hypothetical protein P0M11_00090 [Kaistella sp. PBT33-4]|uniref:hypothetical protein n=1 Tax=Kaistella sp. PBT33-4 TaxID=3032000 RepID=UPI0023D87005|nr:hypothetical protein [Kaistella sp. PBT33-4]MDF0718394.1 hypothetical protein [Kaistella sp. PBT33-4]
MMTDDQRIQIAGYLLAEKLTVDVAMELHDHFCTHISALMQKENISFNEAFDLTKDAWKADLRLVKLGNGKFIPKINKEIGAQQERNVAVYAIFTAAVFLTVISAASHGLSSDHYSVFKTAIWSAAVLVPVVYFLFNIKDIAIAWRMKGLRLNTHQKSFAMVAPGYILMQNTIFSIESQARIQDLFYGSFTKLDLATLVVAPLGLLAYFFGLLSMFKFIRHLRRTKPFLHFIKA